MARVSSTLPPGQLAPLRACHREYQQLAANTGNHHGAMAAALFNLGVEADALPGDVGLELATAAYQGSVSLEPGDADSHYNLGLCYDALGPRRAEEAVTQYRRAVALDPSTADAWTNLGLALKQTGDIDGAVAAHQAAFELVPALRSGYAVRLLGLERGGAFGAEAVASSACSALLGGAGVAVHAQWSGALGAAAARLRAVGYGDRGRMAQVLGLVGAEEGRLEEKWWTGEDYFAMRLDVGVQARLQQEQVEETASGVQRGEGRRQLRLLVRLLLLGCAVPEAEVRRGLELATLTALTDVGLLVPSAGAPGCLIAPVQVYPLYPLPHAAAASLHPISEGPVTTVAAAAAAAAAGAEYRRTLLLATDWAIDTLLPGKCAVMAIGRDSLELVRHPPRPINRAGDAGTPGCISSAATKAQGGSERGAWLDLCCGSGVQAIAALAWGRCGWATCVDISARAVHFTLCNALLNGLTVIAHHLLRPNLFVLTGCMQRLLWSRNIQGRNGPLRAGGGRG
jgi:hypothetical protein